MKKIIIYSTIIFSIYNCNGVFKHTQLTNTSNFKMSNDTIFLNGAISKKTYKEFSKLFEKNLELKALVLEDIPGSIDDDFNLRLGMLINSKGINTCLKSSSIIASGGIDLFLAGQKRSIKRC